MWLIFFGPPGRLTNIDYQQLINITVNYRSFNLQQEIATVNLGKFRKLQHELEEAETRAMLAEKSLSQLRALSRQSTTSVTETVSVSHFTVPDLQPTALTVALTVQCCARLS